MWHHSACCCSSVLVTALLFAPPPPLRRGHLVRASFTLYILDRHPIVGASGVLPLAVHCISSPLSDLRPFTTVAVRFAAPHHPPDRPSPFSSGRVPPRLALVPVCAFALAPPSPALGTTFYYLPQRDPLPRASCCLLLLCPLFFPSFFYFFYFK